MSKIIFNEHRRRQLKLNPSVQSVLDWMIQHIPKFETLLLIRLGPSQIFFDFWQKTSATKNDSGIAP